LSLVKLVQSDPQSYRLAGATRLRFDSSLPDGAARQQYLEQLLDNFATDAGEAAA
jgi:transcription-repair coupling factor (superfamily II helicase)